MDAAITAFLVTVGIVGGLMLPFIVIAVFGAISNAAKLAAVAIIAKAEELQRMPPFDDVEANLNPMTKVLSIRIIKNGKALWQGSATRNDQEAYPTINFTKDQK